MIVFFATDVVVEVVHVVVVVSVVVVLVDVDVVVVVVSVVVVRVVLVVSVVAVAGRWLLIDGWLSVDVCSFGWWLFVFLVLPCCCFISACLLLGQCTR